MGRHGFPALGHLQDWLRFLHLLGNWERGGLSLDRGADRADGTERTGKKGRTGCRGRFQSAPAIGALGSRGSRRSSARRVAEATSLGAPIGIGGAVASWPAAPVLNPASGG